MPGTGGREPGTDWDDLVLVGIVARTHGNKGQVIVNPYTDFIEDRFRVGARFETRLADGTRTTSEVTAARVHQGRPVIGLAGVASIGEAERYAGAELRIDAAEQQALPEGHYYHHQLIGCEVVTADGEPVGRVVAVEGEGQSRLVVDGARRRHEIPLADDICTVDVAARRITVRPPEGLLDL
ncbi:MAG: ribosome maturation factor RimM [Vicinamibacterales bacterium]